VKEVERAGVQIAVSDPHPPPSKDPPATRQDEMQEDPAEPKHPSQPLPPPPRLPQEAPPEEEESTGNSESGGEGASGASMSGVPLNRCPPCRHVHLPDARYGTCGRERTPGDDSLPGGPHAFLDRGP
jgi:hypothetical protein